MHPVITLVGLGQSIANRAAKNTRIVVFHYLIEGVADSIDVILEITGHSFFCCCHIIIIYFAIPQPEGGSNHSGKDCSVTLPSRTNLLSKNLYIQPFHFPLDPSSNT